MNDHLEMKGVLHRVAVPRWSYRHGSLHISLTGLVLVCCVSLVESVSF